MTLRSARHQRGIEHVVLAGLKISTDNSAPDKDQVAKRHHVLMGSIIIRRAMAQCPMATRWRKPRALTAGGTRSTELASGAVVQGSSFAKGRLGSHSA